MCKLGLHAATTATALRMKHTFLHSLNAVDAAPSPVHTHDLVPMNLGTLGNNSVLYSLYYFILHILCHHTPKYNVVILHRRGNFLVSVPEVCLSAMKDKFHDTDQWESSHSSHHPVVHLGQVGCHYTIPRPVSVIQQRPLFFRFILYPLREIMY